MCGELSGTGRRTMRIVLRSHVRLNSAEESCAFISTHSVQFTADFSEPPRIPPPSPQGTMPSPVLTERYGTGAQKHYARGSTRGWYQRAVPEDCTERPGTSTSTARTTTVELTNASTER
eukprot:2578529-Rhodomonas_salina.1